MNDMDSGLLRCQQPPELQGLVFLELDPHAFCSAPLVLKLAIQDIQPFSVLVSWQSRNHSGIRGYQVAYHTMENIDEVTPRRCLYIIVANLWILGLYGISQFVQCSMINFHVPLFTSSCFSSRSFYIPTPIHENLYRIKTHEILIDTIRFIEVHDLRIIL